jgi:hypothetical protein
MALCTCVTYRSVGDISPPDMVMIPSSNAVYSLLRKSHDTMKKWVDTDFLQRIKAIQKLCKASKSDIYLSFDLWSSSNGLTLNGIVAHFFGEDYKLYAILLDLREVIGEHSGENIGQTVVDTIKDYEIENKLGTFIFHNTKGNDTAVRYIIDELNLYDMYEESYARLHCLGCVINLAATEFLFGKNSEALAHQS